MMIANISTQTLVSRNFPLWIKTDFKRLLHNFLFILPFMICWFFIPFFFFYLSFLWNINYLSANEKGLTENLFSGKFLLRPHIFIRPQNFSPFISTTQKLSQSRGMSTSKVINYLFLWLYLLVTWCCYDLLEA